MCGSTVRSRIFWLELPFQRLFLQTQSPSHPSCVELPLWGFCCEGSFPLQGYLSFFRRFSIAQTVNLPG